MLNINTDKKCTCNNTHTQFAFQSPTIVLLKGQYQLADISVSESEESSGSEASGGS